MPLHRYYLNTTPLFPTSQSFTQTLSLLPLDLHQKITSFHFPTDRNLSLCSTLLQRWVYCLPGFNPQPFKRLEDVPIIKDPESGRPSFSGSIEPGKEVIGVMDYNVSHHNPRESSAGISQEKAFVGIAFRAESPGRVGVDIVPTLCRGSGSEFVSMFDDDVAGVFTPLERSVIRSAEDEEERVKMLYLHWGLKEAYVKAVGTGIVGDLLAVEFHGVEVFETGKRTVMDGLQIWVSGVDVTDKWWVEITAIEGVGEVFYFMICADRDGLEDEVERSGVWGEVDFWGDVVGRYGGKEECEVQGGNH